MVLLIQDREVEVSTIEFRHVTYNIQAQTCQIEVIVSDGKESFSIFIPFRYDGDWPDNEVKVFALNHLEDLDISKTSDKTLTSSQDEIPDLINVSDKNWWDFFLFWK